MIQDHTVTVLAGMTKVQADAAIQQYVGTNPDDPVCHAQHAQHDGY